MKWIDERGRLFGRLSIIDLGIILLALIIAAGVVVKFTILDQTSVSTELKPIHYTLEISGVRDYTFNNIREGDVLYVNSTQVGTVTGMSYENYEATVISPGKLWSAEMPERYKVFLEVEGEATQDSDGNYLLGRTVSLFVGNSTMNFSTKFAEFSAGVLDIAYDG